MSNEKPILFKDDMIRAILEGRKCQTRRLLKPQPPEKFCTGDVAAITNGSEWAIGISRIDPRGGQAWPADPEPGFTCRYGKPGDCLVFGDPQIKVEITDVYLEQLQEISEEDAKAEGARSVALDVGAATAWSYREGFKQLWTSIYGPDSWDANPWVWCISFKRIDA